MSAGRKDMVGKLTPLCLAEWGADNLVSPTAALVTLASISLLASTRAMQAFQEEGAERKRAAENSQAGVVFKADTAAGMEKGKVEA